MLNGRIAGENPLAQPGRYAHTIIPIAMGYTIVHYFSLLLIDGQVTWILASDPFRTGANLFGTGVNAINYTIVSTATIAYVQVAAIDLGHVLGVPPLFPSLVGKGLDTVASVRAAGSDALHGLPPAKAGRARPRSNRSAVYSASQAGPGSSASISPGAAARRLVAAEQPGGDAPGPRSSSGRGPTCRRGVGRSGRT
jgi:hypothetical protein